MCYCRLLRNIYKQQYSLRTLEYSHFAAPCPDYVFVFHKNYYIYDEVEVVFPSNARTSLLGQHHYDSLIRP